MTKESPNIKKLKEKRRQGSSKFKFNTCLDMGKIETFEKAYGLKFPEAYKQFMASFNGGMMLEYEENFYIDMTEWEPDGPKWSSFYFYTLDELGYEYTELKSESEMFSDDFKGTFPIIPICNTPKQETIMLVSHEGLSKESPVFISDDIGDMSTYVQIDDNFDSFLTKIVDNDGFPDIKAEPGSEFMSIFLHNSEFVKTAEKEETEDEIIERTSAYIKLNPKSSWTYCDRGNAYLEKGLRKLALFDFNKSIELNEKQSFFYYCRGILLLDYGNKRKALIDLDIAVKLDPENLLLLTGRADALQKLGKQEKALSDCNKVLEKDYTYKLALYVRYRIYKAMGEDKLAQADSDFIDELK